MYARSRPKILPSECALVVGRPREAKAPSARARPSKRTTSGAVWRSLSFGRVYSLFPDEVPPRRIGLASYGHRERVLRKFRLVLDEPGKGKTHCRSDVGRCSSTTTMVPQLSESRKLQDTVQGIVSVASSVSLSTLSSVCRKSARFYRDRVPLVSE